MAYRLEWYRVEVGTDFICHDLNNLHKIAWQEMSVFENFVHSRIGLILTAFAAENTFIPICRLDEVSLALTIP